MVRLEVEACDICRDPYRPTEEVEIRVGETEAIGHLCGEHVDAYRECLRRLEEATSTEVARQPSRPVRSPPRASKKASGRTGRRNTTRELPVLTEEQARKMGL